jgi:hypothetical protein
MKLCGESAYYTAGRKQPAEFQKALESVTGFLSAHNGFTRGLA